MGWNPKVLPENILRRIPREQRAPLGKAGVTNAEANAKYDAKHERELQNDMVNLLSQRNICFDSLRMDKRTRSKNGRPDFYIFLATGKYLCVEAKMPTGSLSDDQKKWIDNFWHQTGQVVHIVKSLMEFRDLLDLHHP